jgi:hypothetical protein
MHYAFSFASFSVKKHGVSETGSASVPEPGSTSVPETGFTSFSKVALLSCRKQTDSISISEVGSASEIYFNNRKLKDGKYVSLNYTPSAQTSYLLTPLALRFSKKLVSRLLFTCSL